VSIGAGFAVLVREPRLSSASSKTTVFINPSWWPTQRRHSIGAGPLIFGTTRQTQGLSAAATSVSSVLSTGFVCAGWIIVPAKEKKEAPLEPGLIHILEKEESSASELCLRAIPPCHAAEPCHGPSRCRDPRCGGAFGQTRRQLLRCWRKLPGGCIRRLFASDVAFYRTAALFSNQNKRIISFILSVIGRKGKVQVDSLKISRARRRSHCLGPAVRTIRFDSIPHRAAAAAALDDHWRRHHGPPSIGVKPMAAIGS
jgi:hypothetical protein